MSTGKRTGRPAKGPHLVIRDPRSRVGKRLYYIRHGKREFSTGFGLDEVEAAQAALSRYIEENAVTPSTIGRKKLDEVRVNDVLLYYLEVKHKEVEAKPEKQKSYDNAYVNVKRLMQWWHDKFVSDIKPSTAEAYMAWRLLQRNPHAKTEAALAKVVSTGTIRREGQIMNAALTVYEDEFLKPYGIVAPRLKLADRGTSRQKYLERGEVARMLMACLGWKWDAEKGQMAHEIGGSKHAPVRVLKRNRRRHTARILIMGVYTGTRHTAMLEAMWEPTPDAPYIDVEAGLFYRRGWDVRETKKRTPTCSIPEELLRHLRRWRRLDHKEGVLYVIHYHGEPLANRVRTSWEGVLEDAGIEKDADVHTLRHTSATWLVQGMKGSGLTWEDIAEYLGMTVEVLKEVYAHHHPDYQANIGEGFKAHRKTATERKRSHLKMVISRD
ncbi:tyrosine-type recombinase/integrase [Microvirga sp. VF16]|uniref:tyrosine-type recombinase/integrase n=1 Tax=Microvirga sp. VF16 TaxID=2807101 RepID=UPI00193E5BE6|nr:tyrosine-type recombinase/integrase [Microvirga sp. VF16]QRM28354.1 tyrosine-type recombinase/integrase [Microvirga sp. VF16]